MKTHTVRVFPSKENCPRETQLAWKLAELAADPVSVEPQVTEMIVNRLIDNAGVAVASVNRPPVVVARAMSLAHPRPGGASLFGLPSGVRCHAEWAAWANGTAVRELDFHDTFLAADYSHPADNLPPLVAVAQQMGVSGQDLIRAAATAYEVQVNLVTGICLHEYKKDHIAHLAPAVAAGLGTLLQLPVETIYQAIQQAVHLSFSTRQSRKGEISSWKAYAPAHAGKLAIEAVDRAMRGEQSPSPIYEGEDSVIAWMLAGKEATYSVPLPEPGEPKRAILETYTKAHSAEYQAQAIIDLAFKMREKISDWDAVEKITLETSHHTHYVIGTGSGDPQKLDPKASRETLDHSIMYILAVALQDGRWHHVDSYAPERAQREDTVRLWKKIETTETKEWTDRYHSRDPKEKAFGGQVTIEMKDGTKVTDRLAFADAHPLGARPFAREQYVEKFQTLVSPWCSQSEKDRFLELVTRLEDLPASQLVDLHPKVDLQPVESSERDSKGLF